MSPFAGYYWALVAAVTSVGVAFGILGGVVTWNSRTNVVLGALLSGAAYVVALSLLEGPRLVLKLGGFGVFPLTMSFLLCYLATRQLRVRNHFHPVWATLAGVVVSLVAVRAIGFLFRVRDWAPSLAALVVSVFLVGVMIYEKARRSGSDGP